MEAPTAEEVKAGAETGKCAEQQLSAVQRKWCADSWRRESWGAGKYGRA